MTESTFWRSIKAGLEESGAHLCRIENIAGSGIPDLNGCLDGREVWIELKMFRGKQIYARNSQLVWMTKRLKVGGDIVVLARKDDEIWAIAGSTFLAASLDAKFSKSVGDKSVATTVPAELALKIFHKPFDWEEVRRVLFGR